VSVTNQKGDIGEAAFVFEAVKKGYWVGKMPQDCPYDFALDHGIGTLSRIQVKYKALSDNGSVILKLDQKSLTYKNRRTYCESNVDYFAIFVPDLNLTALIPIKDVVKGSITLRVSEPKNGQSKGVRYLSEFLSW
jgi:hypothetical protein